MRIKEIYAHDEAIKQALISLDMNPEYVMRRYCEAVLEECDYVVSHAADRMGMHRRTLQRMMRKSRPPMRKRTPQQMRELEAAKCP